MGHTHDLPPRPVYFLCWTDVGVFIMWQNEMKSLNQIKLNVNTMGFQWLKSGKVNACFLHFAKLLRHVKSCEHIVLRLEQ